MFRMLSAGAFLFLAGASALANSTNTNPVAAPEPQMLLALRAVGMVDLSNDDDAGFGTGYGIGFGLRGGDFFVEYDYSKVLEAELDQQAVVMSSFAGSPTFALEYELDAYTHNVFFGRRWGRFAYGEFKVGHSYQRFKDGDDVLDEVNSPAAGVEVGLGGRDGGLGLQYLWLGDDYKQLSLSLRLFF